MISLPNIIKSSAAIHPTFDPTRFYAEPDDAESPVIKQRRLNGTELLQPTHLPLRDALLDELNNLRLDIADVEQELHERQQKLEKLTAQVEELDRKREALEQMEGMSIDDQAKAILQKAEQKAGQMLKRAHEQAAEDIDQMKAKGYLDGLEQGATEAHLRFAEEHEPDIRKLEQLMIGLSSIREDLIAESENDIITLIIVIAEKVIARSFQQDPSVVVDMLRDVLEFNRREEYIKVSISDDLLPAKAKVREDLCEYIRQLGSQIEISVESGGVPGSLIVETPGGITDLSIQTQLGNIHDTLLQEN